MDATNLSLAVFLEAPRLGSVKIQLAQEIGERHALRLYRVLAARALAAVRATGLPAIVWFTPPDARTEMEFWLGSAWELRPQAEGDQGTRLAAAADAVPPGRSWIALLAECPRFTEALLRDACGALEKVAIVLGPAQGGGYYLIGGKLPLPDLFSGMPWGTHRLLAETRERLARANAAWHELPTLREIETAADARAEGLLD
jgi:rSAM/selenodomain-associated transferase 1